ncbi:MAG: T9SS type A sorting domain-containing protein [Bacteroidetes bacterium]|nr:T9SS type A sorting domain-containing protein [Bacteroidota bacterium]
MKKLLFLISALITLSSLAQQPVYFPFPESNAQWNTHMLQMGWPPLEKNYSIIISGDTLINGLLYQKLTIVNPAWYKGAIRQDTANRKVFIIPPAAATEELLYDFTMQVGDTVKGYIENYLNTKDIVENIDTVLVGNNYRKRWKINSGYNIYFIEGIGSTYGLVEYSPGTIVDGPDFSISCFRQNSLTIYPDTITNCGLITSVKPIEIQNDQLRIYPNPSNGSFTIEFDESLAIKEIRLTDLLGKIFFQQQTDNRTKIEITNLRNEIYILTIIDKNNLLINKKIISCP